MPKIKATVNPEAQNSFLPYDGPALVPGSYDAVLKNPSIRESKAGNLYINAVFEVEEAKKSEKAKFNGAGVWGRIMFQHENENHQARFNSFLKAVGVPLKDADIAHESDDDLATSKGSTVTAIGGKKIDGRKVRITLTTDSSSDTQNAVQVDLVTVRKNAEAAEDEEEDTSGPAEEAEDDDEDMEVEVDEETQAEMDAREKELKKTPLADLKEAAKEAGIEIKGLKKADLVEAILDWEFSDEEDEDGEEEAEEEEDEDAEGEAEEGDEELDEEEEDEEDEEAVLRSELSELDRTALKKRLKAGAPDFKVFKSTTDEDLVGQIVHVELETTPF